MKRYRKMFNELWRVQTINYFTDATNVVLGIVLTAVTMVCWVGFKQQVRGFSTDYFVFASACGISIIRNSQYDLDLTVTDWRDKGLFKRFATTPVPNWLLWAAILTFNWFINIAVSVFLFALAMIFQSQREVLGNVQWGPFMVGFIMDVFLSQFMAFFLSVLWKNRALILVVSLVSYFGPMYLLGLGIPWSVVGNYEGLNILTYFAPHRYPLELMQAGWAGTAYPSGAYSGVYQGNMVFPVRLWDVAQNADGTFKATVRDGLADGVSATSWLGQHGFGFGYYAEPIYNYGNPVDINDPKQKALLLYPTGINVIHKGAGWWAPFLVSVGWTALFAGITYAIIKRRLFFGARQYKQFQGVQKHLHYISQIKKAKNLDELDALITYINASENRKPSKPRGRAKFRNNPEMRKAHLKRKELDQEYD